MRSASLIQRVHGTNRVNANTEATLSITTSFSVIGMSCDDCVLALTDEVSTLPGVQTATIDLVADGESRISVTGTEILDINTVGLAVDEAGFELVGIVYTSE